MECLLCNKDFKIITGIHLKNRHKITAAQYKSLFPGNRLCEQSIATRRAEKAWKTKRTNGTGKKILEGVQKKCLMCGTSFYIKRSKSSRKKFCSKMCYSKWQTGKSPSAEVIGKMSMAKKGHTTSEETREKISIANSGKNNGMYGHCYTDSERTEKSIKGKEAARRGSAHPNFNPNKTKFSQYKIECGFHFDFKDYPEEFDFEKVRDIFDPIKNKKGHVRDHIFSIFDGFRLQINPKIISHPANCRLITFSENARKQRHSNTTLEKLQKDIELWSIKYG